MDAKTFVSLLIQKLKDLLTKETLSANPSFVREVEKAIKDLQSLQQNQSLQDSEGQCQVSSVLPTAVYSAKDIIDSLLKRKEFQLERTRKGEINVFKKMVQQSFTCFKSLHSQDLFTLQMEKLRNEISALSCFHEHLLDKKEAETANNIEDVLIGFNNDATSSFLNEGGRQRRQQLWKRSFENCLKDEETIVGQHVDQLADLLIRKIHKTKRNQSPQASFPKVGEGGSGKTIQNQSDYELPDLGSSDDKSGISARNTSEEGQSMLPGKKYLRRFLNKKVIINLLQSLIDFIDDEVPEHSGNHSTTIQATKVAGNKVQEEAPEQDSNGSTNQAKEINEVAGVDSNTATEIIEENSERERDQPTAGAREETDDQSRDKTEEMDSETANDGDSTNSVVAVISGEAGSGKSTLVKTVYNRIDVKRHFTERAWVRVSSESKARDVLLSIVKQTEEGISDLEMEETLSEEELMWILKKRLEDTNYLIVIEDVETPLVWRDVREALNYHSSCNCSSRNNSSGCDRKVNRGGKIIVISSKENAISYADSTLHISPLNDDESWKLFSEKVQSEEDAAVKGQFKEKILELCGRLPLGIVLLAGMLCTKEVTDWSRVIEIANNSTNGDRLALLSYQDLPSLVKPCFLYMALFPKEYEIPVRRLIHLWCAEGFMIPSTSEEIVPEDLAELCFQELVIRNMIQVRWRLDGSPIRCRMHDHLHDIFSQRALDEGFFHLGQLQSSHASVKQLKHVVRRLALAYHGNKNFPSSFIDLQNLRSCVVFDPRVRGTAATEVSLFLNKIIVNRDIAFLKVLDLEGVYKPNLSDAVEKLKLLAYLGLRSTYIHSLSESVGNLSYLETLDLKHTKIQHLPSSIWKAKKLQHLYLNCVHSEIEPGSYFSESPSKLRTLWGLCIKDDSNGQCEFLRKLTRLRKLGLTCRSASCLKIIAQLTELQSLKVRYVGEDSGSHLQPQSMEKNKKLRDVYLMGKLEKSVIDVSFLPSSLRVLTLCESGLEEDPMPVLEQLEDLKILRLLKGSYKGKRMHCLSKGFPKLHVLKLWDLRIPEGWKVEPGAMPCLRVLEISRCEFRKEYDGSHPQQLTGLEHLGTLKELVLTDMKDLGKEVEDSRKILKINNVHIIKRK